MQFDYIVVLLGFFYFSFSKVFVVTDVLSGVLETDRVGSKTHITVKQRNQVVVSGSEVFTDANGCFVSSLCGKRSYSGTDCNVGTKLPSRSVLRG